MKKILLLLSVILSLSILGACGHSEADYEAVYNKIKQDKELDAADYDLMLDYIDDAMSAAKKAKSVKDLEKVEEKFKYAESFINELTYGKPSEEILNKFQKKAEKIYENYKKTQKEVEEKISSLDSDNDEED